MHDGWFCISAPPLCAGSRAGTRLLSSCPNLGALALSIRQVHDPRLCSRVFGEARLANGGAEEQPGRLVAVRLLALCGWLEFVYLPSRDVAGRPNPKRARATTE